MMRLVALTGALALAQGGWPWMIGAAALTVYGLRPPKGRER